MIVVDKRPTPGSSPAAEQVAARADAAASEALARPSSSSWVAAAQGQRDAAAAWREARHPDTARWHDKWAGRFNQLAAAQPDHQQEAQR